MQIDGYFNVRYEPVIKLDVGSSQIELGLPPNDRLRQTHSDDHSQLGCFCRH